MSTARAGMRLRGSRGPHRAARAALACALLACAAFVAALTGGSAPAAPLRGALVPAGSSPSGFGAVAWGQNALRQLGDGTFEAFSTLPRPVSGLSAVTAVAAGGEHSLALLSSGAVMAWGSNADGQLGNGSELTPSTPVAVKGLEGVQAVAAGASHSLALLSSGTVMAWGENEYGQLGDGSTNESDVPVAVKGLTGVRAIAAGGNDSYALLSSGAVMAWGDGEEGELGDGSTKLKSDVPVAVKGLSGVKALAAGGDFALALLTSGAVEAWGNNSYGQLADSEAEEGTNVPVPVNGVSGVTAIAAGARHALALLGGGTVMAWGENNDGELGDGAFANRQETPVSVSGVSGVSAISAGAQDSAALLSSGSAMTWGLDNWGQLGHGVSGSPSALPVEVEGAHELAGISAGGQFMVAFGEPIPEVGSLSPSAGPTAGGTTVTISGSHFEAPATVKFGSVEVSATVTSATSLTATAPPGSGTVAVSVTTPAGTSASVSGDLYTYVPPPTLSKISPKTGSAAGGTTVTIKGTNFTHVTAVEFGATPASSYTVNSPTSITAISPAEPASAVHVIVSTEFGSTAATTSSVYKFAPVIESLTPSSGPTAGGVSVTVTGVGFAPGATATKFKFGTTAVRSVSCASSTECTVLAPAHEAATVEVAAIVNKVKSLKNPSGDDFTYG